MKRDTIQFRSKREREQEVDLKRNYKEIGIPAIAAASRACRAAKPEAARANHPRTTLIPAE
ncbi:hypothetical protein [Aurantimonas sp. VKM B-3413]|uniref:hypothetical protein n=1 Tax=Aurantimonas sp. VKM B-3413 TaxID=2779401 RepID=UPI001E40C7BF|nr:hypothetical protein [Aurantimonas sp. VKM B-3413]MCB8836028.1 hypothetical protein [Aurantimonas sp. VKM B-3413]